MENDSQEIGFSLELPTDVAQGTYSNMAIISHSSSEFVLDFLRIMPGVEKAAVKSRIILTPEHAKRLLLSMKENIGKYEDSFGAIRIPEEPPSEWFAVHKGEA